VLLPQAASAAPEYIRYYRTGLSAAETNDWALVEDMMRRAIADQSEEKAHMLLHRGGYFPHYYLGLARYHLGDCPGALASWAESEHQGAIVGRDEYLDLLRLRKDCQEHDKPSLASGPSKHEPEDGGAKQPSGGAGAEDVDAKTTGKHKTTGKEKVRTGQSLVEKGADPARKTLGAVEDAAPKGSKLATVTHGTKKAVDVADSATDLVDVAMSPSADLEAAINAYFAGKPQRTLDLLAKIDLSDPRARAQVYLFRSAAHFRLHLASDRDGSHLAAARENARRFNREQWRKDFPTELFDPRFVTFVHGAG
jgi:hypothetical protein